MLQIPCEALLVTLMESQRSCNTVLKLQISSLTPAWQLFITLLELIERVFHFSPVSPLSPLAASMYRECHHHMEKWVYGFVHFTHKQVVYRLPSSQCCNGCTVLYTASTSRWCVHCSDSVPSASSGLPGGPAGEGLVGRL